MRSENEAELRGRASRAYRAFRKAIPAAARCSGRPGWPRRIRDGCRSVDHCAVSHRTTRRRNRHPKIRFVGVWDTVPAYGGPITEITRAIDNWFFPLSMPDYALERTRPVRAPRAGDRRRARCIPSAAVGRGARGGADRAEGAWRPDRLQQVWFTGMHADVGGGYPDESLSYVSLLWMMEEAENARACGRLTVIKDRLRRAGQQLRSDPRQPARALAAYYRYQPRKIAAWLDPVDDRTLSLRDPAITDDAGRSRGCCARSMCTKASSTRIATGTDRYAPITLPEKFESSRRSAGGERSRSDRARTNSGPGARAQHRWSAWR